MSRVLAFAAIGALGALGAVALAGAARAQEAPWLFAGGTTDIAAIVDEDGDGPDLTDDCYFKFTGQPALSGNMTFLFVDASGDNCHPSFPCFGTFALNPGADVVITIDSCTGSLSIPTPFRTTFSRPGPPVFVDALVSPNTGMTSDASPAVSVLLCESNGLAAEVTIGGMLAALLPLEFYPDAAHPAYLKVPFLGASIGGTGDVFIPLTGRRATVASQTAPQQTAAELDFGGLCDCGLGGACPGRGVSPAPAASGWGLAITAFGLLAIGAWALRRRPHFAGSLPLP